MRTLNIMIGLAAILGSIGLLVLFMFNAGYALIAVVIFFVCHQIFRMWKRRQNARQQTAESAWRKKV